MVTLMCSDVFWSVISHKESHLLAHSCNQIFDRLLVLGHRNFRFLMTSELSEKDRLHNLILLKSNNLPIICLDVLDNWDCLSNHNQ